MDLSLAWAQVNNPVFIALALLAPKQTTGGSVTTLVFSLSPSRRALSAQKKANAIDLFVGGEPLEGGEKAQWEDQFDAVPAPLTTEERAEWAAKLDGVSCSSDAFFPFPDNVHRARKSGVKYLAAASGSVMDEECIKAADEHGIVFAHTSLRLFHH